MDEASGTPRIIRFGVFEVDFRSGELRKQGLKVKLQEQPFQVLAALLEQPGEVITRETLRRRMWPADTFVDFDHSLSTAINKIREALGDSAENPRFVETLPRRGYRFIAPVDQAGHLPAPTTVESRLTAPLLSISRGRARALFLVIQGGYLVMYGVAFYHMAAVQRVALLLPAGNIALALAFLAVAGAAVHIYLLSAVALDHADSGRLFQRLFAGILLIDLGWAVTPMLLFFKWGELVLLLVAGLAFLPFSQRSLMFTAYAPTGGRI